MGGLGLRVALARFRAKARCASGREHHGHTLENTWRKGKGRGG